MSRTPTLKNPLAASGTGFLARAPNWHFLEFAGPNLARDPVAQCTLALMEQQALDVERIRQYPGRVQVERRVKLG